LGKNRNGNVWEDPDEAEYIQLLNSDEFSSPVKEFSIPLTKEASPTPVVAASHT
jgi:hypothetical protein